MNEKIKNIVSVSSMAAVVLTATYVHIPVFIGTNTMVHLGNAACLLAAFLLGPVKGGLAAGIGSFLFDILNPLFIMSSPFTFLFKFVMAFVCGHFKNAFKFLKKETLINLISGFLASVIYTLLHLFKGFVVNRAILGMTLESTIILSCRSAIISGINTVVSLTVATVLSIVLKKLKF